ncbi:dihydroorotate dehydrogenase electron transfer subunit [Calorimonas adulescens]|jgi:Oxidoreductase FAD-binding domain./Iron-sulfur cluster binding domain of dihydroorotate dehydrogenase B./Oxidoreductase NAD-binding domain.|uniref:Dihydroorotate dehydrogenase electron transfer subunit n=1 Tax=Calorimonas adulescens TaxID=2606906 RepID=A0A5D8QE47_9THEO|nr:dihydroorotate dehydrogenase electron transfer subunit [Calorimonas adulescens]TZE82980.1 dihydroorotate dehydrogenase electron transfer subunit [Calorimonas adulescens]
MLSMIEYNERVSDDIYLMELRSERVAQMARPGQFVHVLVDSEGYILRRPFSICDTDGKTIKILYRVKGVGTRIMSRMIPASSMDIIGPLGRGFDEMDGSVAIVGGGIGLAPLVYLANTIKRGSMFLGFNGKPFGIDLIRNPGIDIRVATMDGSSGYRGNVIELFEAALNDERYSCVYACGPKAMIKEVKRLCNEYGMVGEASFEERMGCALGSCMVCSIPLKDKSGPKYARVCKDGPVFNLSEVIFGRV